MKKKNIPRSGKVALSTYLRRQRECVGLTQREVADELGYSTPQFISSWERAEREPPMNRVRRLASIYDVSAKTLFNMILAQRLLMTERQLRAEFLAHGPKAARQR